MDTSDSRPISAQAAATDDGLAHWKRRMELASQPASHRLAPATLRAAVWAARAFLKARRDLRKQGLRTQVAPPPNLPWGANIGVYGVLNRTKPTCLERALVLQAWLLAFDMPYDVVVGVARSGDAGAGHVKAHAWIDQGRTTGEVDDYTPIHRISPREAG